MTKWIERLPAEWYIERSITFRVKSRPQKIGGRNFFATFAMNFGLDKGQTFYLIKKEAKSFTEA